MSLRSQRKRALIRSKNINRHGLQRPPSPAVKKEIRQRCGFGCVICGAAIVTYEHFDPPFRDAQCHDPRGMTLLCGAHQLETSKGLLSKQTIAEANRDPFCKRVGYAKHLFDLGGKKPKIMMGGADVSDCGHRIAIDGETMLQILAPDSQSSRWRLSCRLVKQDGSVMCKIVENELVLMADNVDIQQQAARFSISSDNETILDLELHPPDALLLKTYCQITKNGRLVIGTEKIPDIAHSMDHPDQPPKMINQTTLRLETGASSCSFLASRFVAPTGLNIKFVNGAVQLTPL